jgi:hypothetical protein
MEPIITQQRSHVFMDTNTSELTAVDQPPDGLLASLNEPGKNCLKETCKSLSCYEE